MFNEVNYWLSLSEVAQKIKSNSILHEHEDIYNEEMVLSRAKGNLILPVMTLYIYKVKVKNIKFDQDAFISF